MICAYTYLGRRDGLAPGAGESQIVQDAIWVHSRPEDALQHIRVKDDGAGLAVHLFLRGTDAGEASSRLERLLKNLRIVPALQAYQRLDVPAELQA